jgi:hypothetical protein
MNAPLLALTFCLLASTVAPTRDTSAEWRDDQELQVAYHSDLGNARLETAILRIINWCTHKYEAGIADGSLSKATGERLITEIQEAAGALEFVLHNSAAFKKLDDGSQTFGVYLGCFESLFGMNPVRDGSGQIYEQFLKSYFAASEATKEMLSTKNPQRTNNSSR